MRFNGYNTFHFDDAKDIILLKRTRKGHHQQQQQQQQQHQQQDIKSGFLPHHRILRKIDP